MSNTIVEPETQTRDVITIQRTKVVPPVCRTWESHLVVIDCDDEAVVGKKEADSAQEESKAHERAPVARFKHDGILAAS